MDIDRLLWGTRLKLGRAKTHVDDLERLVAAFLANEPYVYVVRTNPQLGERTFTVREKEAIPPDVSLIIGDAIHNTRAALDLTIFAMIGDKVDKPWALQFPFGKTLDQFSAELAKRQIHLAGSDVVTAINALEPYEGGKERLWEINALDIADKHKLLVTSQFRAQTTGEELGLLGLDVSTGAQLILIGPASVTVAMTPGGKTARIDTHTTPSTGPPALEEQVAIQPRFGVSITAPNYFQADDVVPLLRGMIARVSEITEDLARRFIG